MSSRRGSMSSDPFEREPVSLERLDAELFGDLKAVGRPTVLNLDEIRLDGGTQPRAELDHELIAEYAEAIKRDAAFPPVDVFYDGSNYWLADGFHRWHGHEQAGQNTIRATIHQGTQRDAILFSVGVNAEHGKRRTNNDKRRAVMVLLNDKDWSQWSDREIARQCKVHHQMVGRLRESLDDSSSERTYVTKHGTKTTMNIGNIQDANRERVAKPQPTEGPERTSGADEPAGQFENEPDRESPHYLTSAEIVQLHTRVLERLYEAGGAMSPNRLRQAINTSYEAFNTVIDEALAGGAIEKRKDAQSGLVTYTLIDQDSPSTSDTAMDADSPDQAAGEQVEVLETLQDFIGLAIDLAQMLEDVRDGVTTMPAEMENGFRNLVDDALDYLKGYETPQGKWIAGVVDLLKHFREDG